MHPPSQDSHFHLPVDLCTSLLSQIIERSMIESDSALFYRREIEKCQEYISLMQAEATHTWEPPSKPEEFENIEDVQFFQSEFCLKNKLSLLQDDRDRAQQKMKITQLSRNNHIRGSIRGSVRSRASSMSVFAWSEHRYSSLKQQNQNKLRQKKGSRQLSLQKLAICRKEMPTKSEKELRQAVLHPPINVPGSKKQTHRKMVFRKKEQAPVEDDGNIPILIQMGYNVTQQTKIRSLGKESLPKLQLTQKKLEKMQSMLGSGKGQANGRKLVISEYEPNRSQIKVSSWKKFNEFVEVKQDDDSPANPQQFTDIHYFTEITTL